MIKPVSYRTHRTKSEEFMSLDPSVEKKRRKQLIREMNELIAEMDAKADQIYALYDVNEEFVEQQEQRDREQQMRFSGVVELGEETEDLIRSLEV
jgi:hypothetical protein